MILLKWFFENGLGFQWKLYFSPERYNQKQLIFLFSDAWIKQPLPWWTACLFFRSLNKLKSASLNRDISLLAQEDLSSNGTASAPTRFHAVYSKWFYKGRQGFSEVHLLQHAFRVLEIITSLRAKGMASVPYFISRFISSVLSRERSLENFTKENQN